jgi:hypothetical protein
VKPRVDALPEGKGGRYFSVDFEALRAEGNARIDRAVTVTEALLAPLRTGPEGETVAQARKRGRAMGEHEARLDRLEVQRRALAARPKRDPLPMRIPIPSRIEAIVDFGAARGEGRRAQIEVGAVAIGACWYHRVLALESEWPTDPSPEALAAYGESVQGELLDRYTEDEVADIGDAVVAKLASRQRDAVEASALVGFTATPPTAPSN